MLGAGEPLSTFVADAHVMTGGEALNVVIGGAKACAFIGQSSKLMHQLALFFMEAKRIPVAGRQPLEAIGYGVDAGEVFHAASKGRKSSLAVRRSGIPNTSLGSLIWSMPRAVASLSSFFMPRSCIA